MSKEKNLELDRLVFFSDAVVAIAITLLALDLKLGEAAHGHLSFKAIGEMWPKFFAFILSFFLIAHFWKIHHQFFANIKQIDDTMMWFNIFWLLFIVILPFTSTLLSEYFNQTVSTFVYSCNMLCVALCQNFIWDYASVRPDYLRESTTEEIIFVYRFDSNVAIFNAILASILSFWSPIAAYIVLFIRPMVVRLFYPLSKQERVREIFLRYKARERKLQLRKLEQQKKRQRPQQQENEPE